MFINIFNSPEMKKLDFRTITAYLFRGWSGIRLGVERGG